LKILILKPSSLGDVIQALPVLRLLKRHWPMAEIYWWIDAGLAPLLEGDPDLAGSVRFERKRWGNPRHWPEMWRSILSLRRAHFDLVIDLQCLARSAAFGWLASGHTLIGLDEIREGSRGFYDVAIPRTSFHMHAVDWYLSVLPALGVPTQRSYEWLPGRPAVAQAIRDQWPGGGRWIALQPGARWLNKRWPVSHFAELVRRLAQSDPEVRFVILGDRGDQPLGELISSRAAERCLNLCGRTSLPEMIEWVRRCDAMVTNDTGPMHAAAALGKPLIALFGPTEPCRTGPYGQLDKVIRQQLPCAPCLKSRCHFDKPEECLRAISPAQVFARMRAEGMI
jgi:lipopolysaccharide heptosyltransferase II